MLCESNLQQPGLARSSVHGAATVPPGCKACVGVFVFVCFLYNSFVLGLRAGLLLVARMCSWAGCRGFVFYLEVTQHSHV